MNIYCDLSLENNFMSNLLLQQTRILSKGLVSKIM